MPGAEQALGEMEMEDAEILPAHGRARGKFSVGSVPHRKAIVRYTEPDDFGFHIFFGIGERDRQAIEESRDNKPEKIYLQRTLFRPFPLAETRFT